MSMEGQSYRVAPRLPDPIGAPPDVVVNLIKCPSFESATVGPSGIPGTNDWNITQSGAVDNTQTTDWSTSGTHSLRFATTDANDNFVELRTDLMPVSPSLMYYGLVNFRGNPDPDPQWSIGMAVLWYTSDDVLINEVGGAPVTLEDFVNGTGVASPSPSNAAKAKIRVYASIAAGSAVGTYGFLDSVMFGTSSVNFDGDTTDAGGYVYDWTATPHESTSTRTPV